MTTATLPTPGRFGHIAPFEFELYGGLSPIKDDGPIQHGPATYTSSPLDATNYMGWMCIIYCLYLYNNSEG